MANPVILEEVRKFIVYAIRNSVNKKEREKIARSKQWTEERAKNFEDNLIEFYTKAASKRVTDKGLCEYAKIVAKANGVELSDSIKYYLILLNV